MPFLLAFVALLAAGRLHAADLPDATRRAQLVDMVRQDCGATA